MDKEIGFINDRMARIMAGVFVDKWIRLDVKLYELVERILTEMVYEKVLDKPVTL